MPMRTRVAIATRAPILALLIASAVVVTAGPAFAADHTIKGTVTLTDSGIVSGGGPTCSGGGGYDDMRAGAQVRVRDGNGKTLAVSSLRTGKSVADPKYHIVVTCIFPFTVKVAPDAKFYGIEVAHRGELTYSKRQLDKKKWRVDFTLGGST